MIPNLTPKLFLLLTLTIASLTASGAEQTPPAAAAKPVTEQKPREAAPAAMDKPTDNAIANIVKNGGAAITYYGDSRDFNTLDILTYADLPGGVKFWGFTDIHSDMHKPSARFELTRYFMEYRLSREIPSNWVFGIKGLGVQVEYNDATGPNNSLLNFSPLTYKLELELPWEKKGWVQFRAFPYVTKGDRQAISFTCFIPITDRLALGGFADWNFIDRAPDRWVAEPQLTYRIYKNISVALEFRYNEFEMASKTLSGWGIASGLEIKF